jgi:RNA polymerase sigma-70 factor (ECF subfamily)
MTDPAAATPGRRTAAGCERLVQAFLEVRAELVSTLFFLLGNYEDAQDATQEAFVKCWRRRHKAARIRNYRAWIFRVGLNAARDLQRNAWRRRARPLEHAPAPDGCSSSSPADVLVRGEDMERLRTALLDLRREEKEVFLLRQNGDLTYEDIARVCRRPVGTVKTQMRAALQKLRRVLHDGPPE